MERLDLGVERYPTNLTAEAASSAGLGRERLLQLGVFGFGGDEDGNVGVRVFPEREEILVGGERPHAGGIGIRALRGFRLRSVRTSHAQMRQRSRPAVPDNAAVVENLLKLGSGSAALSGCQVCLPAYIHVIEAGNIVDEPN